jgi:hypothetical protein
MIRLTRNILMVLFLVIFIGCEDEEEPAATIEFKTGIGYISVDTTIAQGSSVTVGIIAKKAENNLKTYNVSVSYDGAFTTTTVENFIIPADQNTHYDKDVNLTVRNKAGTGKYYFTIVDADGNVIQKNLTFTIE